MSNVFRKFAKQTSEAVGSSWAFVISVCILLIWGVTGPLFNFSDSWQLIINTGTTIVTFLMVFLIQNTQNRETKAIHLKLDELIRAVKPARNNMIDLEDMGDEEIDKIESEFKNIRKKN